VFALRDTYDERGAVQRVRESGGTMTREAVVKRARELTTIYGSSLGSLGLQECIVSLVDDATQDLRAQVKRWEDLEVSRASCCQQNEERAEKAEAELEDMRSTVPHCTGCGVVLNCQGETSREHAWLLMDENKKLKAELEAMRDAD
jgi:hypothetical protein